MQIKEGLAEAETALRHSVESPRMEARLILQAILSVNQAWLIAHDLETLDEAAILHMQAWVERRRLGEPMAYILGQREFYGRMFKVSPDTLIPRPETEHLVEAALARLPAHEPVRVLDIGTGSGCIAITLKLERPEWRVSALDISPGALAMAQANALHLGATITWLESDLFSAVPHHRFDLIISNPPYVAAADPHLEQDDLRFEPRAALASGEDGLTVIGALIEQAPTYLENPGWLMFEHGWDQAEAVAQRLSASHFNTIFMARDLAGQARVSGGKID